MYGMQFPAHDGEFACVFFDVSGVVRHGAAIGFLPQDPAITDTATAVFRDDVIAGFRCRDSQLVNHPGQAHLVEGLERLPGMEKFEQNRRVVFQVKTVTGGTAAIGHIVRQLDRNRFRMGGFLFFHIE